MDAYYFIFLWLGIMALFANINRVAVAEHIFKDGTIKYKLWFSILAFLPVFLLASLGKPISDTIAYLTIYDGLPISVSGLVERISNMESGQGFVVLGVFIKRIFGNGNEAYRIIIGLIHSIPLIYIYRKYSVNYILSIYLFVASACHIGWMMNGLRQFVAVVIIFAATPLMIDKKYVRLIFIVLLASTIHSSALIMLPIIFIVQGKAWNRKTIFYMIIAGIAMYAFSINENLFDALLVGTEYEGTVSSWRVLGDDGVNPIRVLVNAIPMILAYIGRKTVVEENKPIIHISINMSIITVGLYMIAMVTSGVTVGRIPIYTSLYNFILLPYLVKKLFSNNSSKIITVAMMCLYFVYYLYET